MRDRITVERSLFYVHQHHVDEFITISQKIKEFDYLIEEGGLSKNDGWIIAFHVWLLFYPDEQDIIQSAEKELYYPSNFILYNELMNNMFFKQIKKNNMSTEYVYIASLSFANGINQWICNIVKKYGFIFMKNEMNKVSYFDSHLGCQEEIKRFSQYQAKLVKAFVKELKFCSSFDMILNDSYEKTLRLYKEKPMEDVRI